MAGENRIILKIEGSEKNQHRLSLSTFVEKIKRFQALLQCSADEAAGELGKKVQFELGTIKRASPITLEAVPAPDTNKEAAVATVTHFTHNFDSVSKGKLNSVSPQWCQIANNFATYKSDEFSLTEIETTSGVSSNKRSLMLDASLFVGIEKRPVTPMDECINTVDGRLERIDIHKARNVFDLYPALWGAPKVVCKFSKELLPEAQSLLGCFVAVRGKCFYHSGKAFPHKMEVLKIEKLPPSEDLPTWQDIYGIAPNATGDLSSEEFVRQQRDEWDPK